MKPSKPMHWLSISKQSREHGQHEAATSSVTLQVFDQIDIALHICHESEA